ncbi:MAG: autotransporter outer membrane beta-barrel domain-containing protein [Selenomonadaceae bacterium]|nr:autotransporter outer membrane beta-barrel domain-containing protein [Selenomonadaceae bacterium]
MSLVHDNFIVINGVTVNGVVGGVSIYYGNGIVGDVYGNRVEINDSTVGNVSGGEIAYAYITTGTVPTDFSAALGNVHNNSVFINAGSTVTNGVVGGSALGGNAYDNKIYITDSTISGEILGGYSISGKAYNNEVNINGNVDLSNADLIGGKVGDKISPEGNTLNINTWNVTAKSVDGFEFINFNNPLAYGTGLTVSDTVKLYGGLEKISVGTPGYSNIGKGSVLNLIYANNGISLNNVAGLTSSADLLDGTNTYMTTMSKGATFDYALALSLSADGKSLTGLVSQNLGAKPETATTSKAQLANVIPVNAGTDVLMRGFDDFVGSNIAEDDDGYFTDKAQAAEEVREQHGFEIFGNVGYGKLRTKTGDGGHLNTETANFDLGLARTYEGASGRWTIAPVFEHGKGNYDAVLSNGIRGFGDTKYYAGGLIGRRMTDSGFYVEMSARFGRTKNNFASDDFIYQNELVRATYHTSAPVFSGHVRIGQAKRLNKSNLLDMYAIYAYSRQGGSRATLSTGEPYNFSSISSSRFRLGYRLTTRTSKISRIYTGLAYQYENTSDSETRAFDGDGNYWSLPSAGSKGSSGMIEIGWLIKPKQNNPWFVDVNATAWFGHQKGVTAMAKIKKSF